MYEFFFIENAPAVTNPFISFLGENIFLFNIKSHLWSHKVRGMVVMPQSLCLTVHFTP